MILWTFSIGRSKMVLDDLGGFFGWFKKCSVTQFSYHVLPKVRAFFSKTPPASFLQQKTTASLGHWRLWRLLGWHIAWKPSRPEACFGLEAIYEPHLDWILRQVERILLAKQYKQDDKFSGVFSNDQWSFSAMTSVLHLGSHLAVRHIIFQSRKWTSGHKEKSQLR